MPRPSRRWYCESRGWWYTRIKGRRIGLAKGPKVASQKAALAEFHRVLGEVDTPPRNTLSVDELCVEFMYRGLHGLDTSTAERYRRWLDPFVDSFPPQ